MTAGLPLWQILLMAAPVIGSFIGVLIRRLPAGLPVLWARSHCEHCGHVLQGHDLVPLLSWILLKARCRYCGARIEPFYPLIEIAACAAAIAAWPLQQPQARILAVLLGWAALTIIAARNSLRIRLALALTLGGIGCVLGWNWAFGFSCALAAAFLTEHLTGKKQDHLALSVFSACLLSLSWSYYSVPTALLAPSIVLAACLATLSATDYTLLRLPDFLTLPLLTGGIALGFMGLAPLPIDRLAGAITGYLALALLAAGYKKLRNRDGMGLGDAKLLAAAGAWLGWAALPSVLLIASSAALLWGIARYILDRNTLNQPLPFGVALSGAIWLVWLYDPLTIV